MGAPEQGSSNCRRTVFTGQRAMAAAEGLIEAAEATRNSHVLSFTLLVYGLAHCDADPVRA